MRERAARRRSVLARAAAGRCRRFLTVTGEYAGPRAQAGGGASAPPPSCESHRDGGGEDSLAAELLRSPSPERRPPSSGRRDFLPPSQREIERRRGANGIRVSRDFQPVVVLTWRKGRSTVGSHPTARSKPAHRAGRGPNSRPVAGHGPRPGRCHCDASERRR
jgi:hypothetical protein